MLGMTFLAQGAAPIDTASNSSSEAVSGSIQLLYFTASWCGPCQMMKQQTWPNPLVQQALERYAFTTVDVDAEPEIAKKWAVRAMPTYVIVDSSGSHELTRRSGFLDAHQMANWLNQAHAQAKLSIASILTAQALDQKNKLQMKPLLDDAIDADTLKSAQAALYALLAHRNKLETAPTEALDQYLNKIAQTRPERLLVSILHEDLQVRAYIAKALRVNNIILDPWASYQDRKLMLEESLKTLKSHTP